jgi:hypothetical protein
MQAITTLRSSKQVDNQVPHLKKPLILQNRRRARPAGDAGPNKVIPSAEDHSKYVPKAPYPERFMAPKKSSKVDDILEVFKQVQINISFLDAIQQVHS